MLHHLWRIVCNIWEYLQMTTVIDWKQSAVMGLCFGGAALIISGLEALKEEYLPFVHVWLDRAKVGVAIVVWHFALILLFLSL